MPCAVRARSGCPDSARVGPLSRAHAGIPDSSRLSKLGALEVRSRRAQLRVAFLSGYVGDFSRSVAPINDLTIEMAGLGILKEMVPAPGRTLGFVLTRRRGVRDGLRPPSVRRRKSDGRADAASDPRPETAESAASDVPPDLATAVDRCLQRDVTKRWPDAKSLRE